MLFRSHVRWRSRSLMGLRPYGKGLKRSCFCASTTQLLFKPFPHCFSHSWILYHISSFLSFVCIILSGFFWRLTFPPADHIMEKTMRNLTFFVFFCYYPQRIPPGFHVSERHMKPEDRSAKMVKKTILCAFCCCERQGRKQ